MNAQTLRRWSQIKIFMHLLLAICSLLVFWCQGASAMHLTPLFNLEHRRRHHQLSEPQNHLFSLIENSTLRHASPIHYQQQPQEMPASQHEQRLQRLWQMRMREKRSRIQAHRKQKLFLQQLLDQRHETPAENLKLSANPNLNINNLKHLINHNIITHHNGNNILSHAGGDEERHQLYETLNEIMANISVASNRNRRESRFHHLPSMPTPQQNRNKDRQRRRRYCSARDPRTLAFEAPTVFEGKIKSMTPDRQANFSVTVEILKAHKQQTNFPLPQQVRLQFAYKNASECDIYREEFRHRGFVRDELEQGKIYFLFVKQISLGNFTILGQPIKKISRTAKDVELGVSERYGELQVCFFIIDYFGFKLKDKQSEIERKTIV